MTNLNPALRCSTSCAWSFNSSVSQSTAVLAHRLANTHAVYTPVGSHDYLWLLLLAESMSVLVTREVPFWACLPIPPTWVPFCTSTPKSSGPGKILSLLVCTCSRSMNWRFHKSLPGHSVDPGGLLAFLQKACGWECQEVALSVLSSLLMVYFSASLHLWGGFIGTAMNFGREKRRWLGT